MPHASTWFPQEDNTNGPSNGEDDTLQVASERISIKCPITLLPMQDPVTSTKCPHSFEREAILSMMNASDVRVDSEGAAARRGTQSVKGMKCPVCEVVRFPPPT